MINCGFYHTILLYGNRAYTCGYNGKNLYLSSYCSIANGQLGIGAEKVADIFQIVQVSEKMTNISTSGGYHSLLLDSQGVVCSCGDNHYGQLGSGEFNKNRNVPSSVSFPSKNMKCQKIFTGMRTSYFLNDKGELFCVGSNKYGELGLGEHGNNKCVPVKNTFFGSKKIVDVKSGASHTFFKTSRGQLFCCGNNKWGELGLGHYKRVYTPIPFIWNREQGRIKKICVGARHCAILVEDEKTERTQVFTFGYNEYGQLGVGDTKNRNVPTEVKFDGKMNDIFVVGHRTFFIDKGGKVFGCGSNEYREIDEIETDKILNPKKLKDCSDMKISEVWGGNDFCIFVKRGGKNETIRLFGKGYNGDGELGCGDRENKKKLTEIKLVQQKTK